MTKTIWVDTTGASTTYVPREKPIQESVAPFSGTISGAAPATTNLGTNSGQRILAADGTWIPQPAFTSGGADQLETLRPSVISPSYSANPPTVTDSAKAYDVDTNHATTFGQWYAAQEARTNNRVDIFSLTTWASKTQTWTAATINVSRSYAILQDGESSATSGSSSKTSSVKYEFSTNNGSSWTTLGTDTAASIPTAPQTLSMALGSLTPTMGNILVKVTITRGGGGTIYEDGVSLPGLTGEVDLKLFDVWIDGTYAGGAGNITCNNLTVTGDATFQNKIYDSTASSGSTGQVLKVASNGKVEWATDSAGTGTVTSITTTGANGVTISGGSTQTITTSGTFALALGNITPTSISTGTGSFSGDVEFAASIKSPNGSNSPVTIVPDGTGDLHVNADSLRLGDNNANATIATNGTGDLILTTHEGSGVEGVIRLYDGANGNITLTPHGTGQVQVGSDQVVTLTASQTLTNKTLTSPTLTTPALGTPSSGNLANCTFPTLNQNTTGNAATASALQTARNINGVSFNGTADITVTAAASTLTGTTLASGVTASSLTSVGTLGSLTVSGATSLATSSGNVGIGVTPSAWFPSVYTAIDVGASSCFGGYASGASGDELTFVAGNVYFNSSNTPIYKANGFATNYRQFNGVHQWFNAPSGTAGNAITFTQAMTLDSSGNLGIGVTPSLPLHVYNSGAALAYFESTNANGPYVIWRSSGTSIGDVGSGKGISGSGNVTDFMIASRSTYPMILGTGSTERMRIDSSGNVGIGTSSTTFRLDVQGSSSGYLEAIRFKNTNSAGYLTTSWTVGSAEATIRYAPGSFFKIGPDSGDTTSPIVFATNNGTERMRITSTEVKATVPFIGNSGTKGFGAVTTTTSTSTPTGGSSGDHYYIY